MEYNNKNCEKILNEKNFYDDFIEKILKDTYCYKEYDYLSHDKEWQERFNDYIKGRKTLPLLYDPFFKNIFNPDIHIGRLSELLSCILCQEVTVLEVLPSESSSFLGTLIIMDMVVRMADGSIANIEIQKVPYGFPAERISCYSSDLIMRQYRRLSSGKNDRFSYKDMHKVHTIIFFESSNEKLISRTDVKNYFHVGKTVFNSGIELELLQEYHLISLDTYRKYRYSDIIKGNVNSTEYDCDEDMYSDVVTDEMKYNRLKYLSLFSVENTEDVENLKSIFPELTDIFKDMDAYLARPKEVLGMFSEALRIMDRNTAMLMVDEYRKEAEQMKEQIERAKEERDNVRKERDNVKKEYDDAKKEYDIVRRERDNAIKERDDIRQQYEEQIENLRAELEMYKSK